MTIELAADQQGALAHEIVDPAAWLANVEATFSPAKAAAAAVTKAAGLMEAYLSERHEPDYMTAAERAAVPPPLDKVKHEKCRHIDGIMVAALEAGVVYDGAVYDCDPQSTANITAIAAGIAAGQGLPGGGDTVGYWDKANVVHQMTETEFLAFGAAVRDAVAGLRYIARQKKNAVQALETHTEVDAYDVFSGWSP